MPNKTHMIETSIIIFVGMFLHLCRLSIIELCYSKLPVLMPNAASSLFVFSVLCIFSKLRPLWPQNLHVPQRFLIFLVELALILCATDLLLRQVWLNSLKVLNLICNFLGQYILSANQSFLLYNAPKLSSWLRNDAFYIARFFLAILTFMFMLDTTGYKEFLQVKARNRGGSNNKVLNLPSSENLTIDACNWEEVRIPKSINSSKPVQFDVYDLPCVPQEDILDMANRVSAKQRNQCNARKNRRKSKVVLNDESNEIDC